MTPIRRALSIFALALILVAPAACGDGERTDGVAGATSADVAGTSGGSPATSDPTEVHVIISEFAFDPPSVSVTPGSTIVFENKDDSDHTATASDGSFNTGTIARGTSKSVVVDQSGSFAYRCSFHPFMKGVVKVTSS